MPLPRRKDAGAVEAPVLNLLSARVRLSEVDEDTEPRTVIRSSDGKSFTFDPAFTCKVEIVDDGGDGSDNGTVFEERFKYKQDKGGKWFLQENSKLGALAKTVHPTYFEDETIPELAADDLEGFEMLCRVKPKKNPTTGAVVGSSIDWETMRPVPPRGKAKAAAVEESEADFDSIAT